MTLSASTVCHRIFHQNIAGEPKALRALWMQPVADGNDWVCEAVIEWPDRPWSSLRVFGADSVQALLLAIKAVASELYAADPQVYLYEPDDVLDLPILSTAADLESARTKGRS